MSTILKENIMKNMRIYLSVCLLAFGCMVFAQEQPMSSKKLLKQAKQLMKVGDYYTASDFLDQVLQDEPENYVVMDMLAEAYVLSRDYENAKKTYKRLYEEAPLAYPKAQFNYALALINEGRYDEAKDLLKTFSKKYKGSDKTVYKRAIKKGYLPGIDLASQLMKKPLEVKINHLDKSINKAYTECSPMAIGDSVLVFSSMKSDTIVYIDPKDKDAKPFVAQFYYAIYDGKNWAGQGEWKEGNFNEPEMYTGNGAFSRDKKRFVFTKCVDMPDGKVQCKLYQSINQGGAWLHAEELNEFINLPGFTATQPTFGYDEKKKRDVLYFVSDREEGGLGGLDVWYSVFDRKKSKDWTAPKNLKRKVNSASDDMTPFYDLETGQLYFSSAGRPGLGGLDIYSVKGSMKKWSKAQNVGYPINSSADDLYYVPSMSREGGFFTSNREGGTALKNPTCCDDLYYFKWRNIVRLAVDGIALDATDSTKTPIKDVTVSLYSIQDSTNEEVLVKSDSTDGKTGLYFLNLLPNTRYKLVGYKKGYFTGQTTISTVGLTVSDTLRASDIMMKLIPPKDSAIAITSMYFEFGKTEVNKASKDHLREVLVKQLKDNPSIIIEIGAHTDDVGSELYNMQLSQKRADNIVAFLVDNGISKKRLIAKGYGETLPIAPNKLDDGSDNPEGRAKNRRTEFRVLTELSDEALYDLEEGE